ncbi:MAG: D-2-hydroxyacid dehydrogenase [Haloarculaceae archaeon]
MEIERLAVHDSVAPLCPPDALADALAELDATVEVVGDDAAADADVMADYDAVVTLEHREAFLAVPWVHLVVVGTSQIPVAAYRDAGVALTNSAGFQGDAVGETVLAFMLAFARGVRQYVAAQERHEWEPLAPEEVFTLEGESLCVVGLGNLGRGIAARADAVGMTVTGVRRDPDPVEHVQAVYAADDLHEALADARFVALAVPLTDDTRDLIGAAELAAMREDAYLVNVARGDVVTEDALVHALADDGIAGAALDVFEREPLPSESPLWDLESVVITPHRASLSADYYREVAAIVRENAAALRAGGALRNRVD